MEEPVALPCDPTDPEQAAVVDALLRRAAEAAGDHALSEQARRARAHGEVVAVVVTVGGGDSGGPMVAGYGQLRLPAHEAGAGAEPLAEGEVVVDPAADRASVLPALLVGLADEADRRRRPVRLWITRPDDAVDAAARTCGFAAERDLLQLRCPLPLTVAAPDHRRTRSFHPGQDDEAWIEANNRAFAGHPEQGRWDHTTLVERMAEPWFDPDGFRVLDADGDVGIAAWCWTKMHSTTTPPMGEIYVIGVDPSAQGRGLGRLLAVDGLDWLAGRGLTTGMLYVDAANETARDLYASLGFTEHHRDRAYLRSPTT